MNLNAEHLEGLVNWIEQSIDGAGDDPQFDNWAIREAYEEAERLMGEEDDGMPMSDSIQQEDWVVAIDMARARRRRNLRREIPLVSYYQSAKVFYTVIKARKEMNRVKAAYPEACIRRDSAWPHRNGWIIEVVCQDWHAWVG